MWHKTSTPELEANTSLCPFTTYPYTSPWLTHSWQSEMNVIFLRWHWKLPVVSYHRLHISFFNRICPTCAFIQKTIFFFLNVRHLVRRVHTYSICTHSHSPHKVDETINMPFETHKWVWSHWAHCKTLPVANTSVKRSVSRYSRFTFSLLFQWQWWCNFMGNTPLIINARPVTVHCFITFVFLFS